MAAPRSWRGIALLLGFAFLYVPVGWIALYSFSAAPDSGTWGGFSLRWYAALLEDEAFRVAALRSLALAALAATLAAFLGTLAGFALARIGSFRGRSLMLSLLAVPIFAPEILMAFALLMLFAGIESASGLRGAKGVVPVVIGHATMGISLAASIVFARLARFDRSLEEAALDLGARPLRVLRTVTLPLALPGIASGWLLAFTLSFDDVITSSFLAGAANTTLPMLVYSSIRVGVKPQINVIGTVIVASVTVVVVIAMLTGSALAGRRGRAKEPH